ATTPRASGLTLGLCSDFEEGKSEIIRSLYLLGFQMAPRIGFSVCPPRGQREQPRSRRDELATLQSPRRHGRAASAARRPGGQRAVPPGRRTVNTEPLPGSLVTVTSPPIMRASLRVVARPSPVPPKR